MNEDLIKEYYNRILDYLYRNLECIKPLIQKKGYTKEEFERDMENTLNRDNEFMYYICPYNELEKSYNLDFERVATVKQKIEIIYPKTRFNEMLPFRLIKRMKYGELQEFDLKIWRMYESSPLFDGSVQAKEALMNLMFQFRLFEKDKELSKRQKDFENIFINLDYSVSHNELAEIMKNMKPHLQRIGLTPFEFKDLFDSVDDYEYRLSMESKIPPRYNETFISVMSKQIIKQISKKTKLSGKALSDFLEYYYEKVRIKRYYLRDDIDDVTKANVKRLLCMAGLSGKWSLEKVIELFSNLDSKIEGNFYNFFLENYPFILHRNISARNFDILVYRFSEIVESLYEKECYDYDMFDVFAYLQFQTFDNVKMGNEEFASLASYAGVMSQKNFEWYQHLYDKARMRKSTKIPDIHNIYEEQVNGRTYKIEVKMLELDNPLNVLIGESGYSNCCQVKGKAGEPCIEYAASEGRIFCVWLVNGSEKILLAQSLAWMNQNCLCFDSIEGTNLMGINTSLNKKRLYRTLVKKAYKLAADELIEKSKRTLEDALSNFNLTEKEEIIRHQQIKQVSVGKGKDVFHVSESFLKISGSIEPASTLIYRDSFTQYLLAGSSSVKIDETYKDANIYRKSREISLLNPEDLFALREVYDMSEKTKFDGYYMENGDYRYKTYEELEKSYGPLQIIKGDDWYIIFSETNDVIIIHDILKALPRFYDETEIQLTEFFNQFTVILAHSINEGETKPIIINRGVEFLELLSGFTIISKNPFTVVASTEFINNNYLDKNEDTKSYI